MGWKMLADKYIQLGETPSGIQKQGVPEARIAQAVGGGDTADDELEARLAGLKK